MFTCLIIGLVLYIRMRPTYLRLFLVWLSIQCSSEIILYLFYNQFPKGELVRIVYSIINFLGYIIYSYVLSRRVLMGYWMRKYLWISNICYCLFSVYYLFFQLGNKNSATDIFLILAILVTILMLYYFWYIISSKDIIVLSKEPIFWIATGSLFFYTGNIVATGFFHRIAHASTELARMLYKLNHVLGVVLYILCIIAFILSTKTESKNV
jgi:hypothetical protein